MRIYQNPLEAVREVERDLDHMGIRVQIQTMQDKFVGNDPDYLTKEVRWYGFQISNWKYDDRQAREVVQYILKDEKKTDQVMEYMALEFTDRTAREPSNPGNAFKARYELWKEFMHDGKFAYTYSERLVPQWNKFFLELRQRPGTRQAIINIHSNIMPYNSYRSAGFHQVEVSADHTNTGGSGRIPCSLLYQAMIREGRLDWGYVMRSCDFLTHFPVDILLAMRLQGWAAEALHLQPGMFTYFTGSLHAYHKDLKTRGIF